ncbi:hypothetical protein Tco_1301783 [Tanacetum coccineum]
MLEETSTKFHTMLGVPALTSKELSLDGRHDVDNHGQRSLQLAALARNILIASSLATEAKDSSKSRHSS